MKIGMKLKFFLISFILLMALSPAVYADPVDIGDIIKFIDRPGSPGGEFGVKEWLGGSNYTGELFVTFCVEYREYIDFSNLFRIDNISNIAIQGGEGPGGDPLDPKTAWLYTQFRNNTLSGYTGDASSANALQNAIWYIEGEISSLPAGKATDWYNAAVAAGWTDIQDVRVMNLSWYTGTLAGQRAQDQLVLAPVPEPGTLLLLGSGLLGLGIWGRKKRRK